MNNTHKTQRHFFEAITKKKLNELFHRADSTRSPNNVSILAKHIGQYLESPLKVESVVNENKAYCDIIITYYKSEKEIGHFTIHCKVDDKTLRNSSRKQGRIHLKNNNTCYTVKCKSKPLPNANTSVEISYETGQFIHPILKKCLDYTLNVLNQYMDFNSNLSLDIPMTKYKYKEHSCMCCETVKQFNSNPKTRFRKTVRASLQSRKLTNLSKKANTISHV
jgi:hypothetical protein